MMPPRVRLHRLCRFSAAGRRVSGAAAAVVLAAPAPAIAQDGSGGGDSPLRLKRLQSGTFGLLVVDLDGTGFASTATRMNATAVQADAADAVAKIRFNQDVGEMTRGSLREIQKHITVRHGAWPIGHDIEFAFENRYRPKDGPSASVPCALLLDALITGRELDEKFASTGDLNADGAVQPVGGVGAKVEAATAAGCNVVAVPARNADAISDLLIMDGPAALAAIQVFSIESFDDAVALAGRERPAELVEALKEFAEVQSAVSRQPRALAGLLRNSSVQDRLRSVLEKAPGHLSARLLLLAGLGRAPQSLSAVGSLTAIQQAAAAILEAANEGQFASEADSLRPDAIGDALSQLRRLRRKLDRRTLPFSDALADFGTLLRDMVVDPPNSASERVKLLERVTRAAKRVDHEFAELRRNREIMEELL